MLHIYNIVQYICSLHKHIYIIIIYIVNLGSFVSVLSSEQEQDRFNQTREKTAKKNKKKHKKT